MKFLMNNKEFLSLALGITSAFLAMAWWGFFFITLISFSYFSFIMSIKNYRIYNLAKIELKKNIYNIELDSANTNADSNQENTDKKIIKKAFNKKYFYIKSKYIFYMGVFIYTIVSYAIILGII